MITITSANVHELPSSFAGFIISPPAFMQDTYQQILDWQCQPEINDHSLDWQALPESSIVLFVGKDSIVYARHEGAHYQKIVDLFNTNTIPTPYTYASDPHAVLSQMKSLNPGIAVYWQKTRSLKTGTQHSDTCRMAFGRFDSSCPRCQELALGSPARKGWRNRSSR